MRCMDGLAWIICYGRNYEVGSMGVGAGLYVYDVVVKSSRSVPHLLLSSCHNIRMPEQSIYGTLR